MTDDLTRYLRENRDRYTREALTERLVAEGHDRAAIENAWARLAHEDRPAVARDVGPGTGIAIAITAIVIVAVYGFSVVLALLAIGGPEGALSPPVLVVGVYALAMIAGGLFSLYRLFRTPSAGTGAAGILGAFALSVLIFLGLSGLCIAGLNVTAV